MRFAVMLLLALGGIARADDRTDAAEHAARDCDADVVRFRYDADSIAGIADFAAVWQQLESDRVELAHACDGLSDDASTMHDAAVDVDPGDAYAVARHQAIHHGRAASNALRDADPLFHLVATRVVPPPPITSVAWAPHADYERDCELGDSAACTRASAALDPDAKRAWQTRACAKRGVADACFAIGKPARGAKLLDRACRSRNDAVACHRLATFYADTPRKAKAYEKLERRFAEAAR